MLFIRSKKRQHRKMEDLFTSQFKSVYSYFYKSRYCSERLFPDLGIDTYKRFFLRYYPDWKTFLEEHRSVPSVEEWELDNEKKDTIRYTYCVYANYASNHVIIHFYYKNCPNSTGNGKWGFEINLSHDISIFIDGIEHYDDIINLIDDLVYNFELNEKNEQIQHDQKIKSIYSTMQ